MELEKSQTIVRRKREKEDRAKFTNESEDVLLRDSDRSQSGMDSSLAGCVYGGVIGCHHAQMAGGPGQDHRHW